VGVGAPSQGFRSQQCGWMQLSDMQARDIVCTRDSVPASPSGRRGWIVLQGIYLDEPGGRDMLAITCIIVIRAQENMGARVSDDLWLVLKIKCMTTSRTVN
jgi:hypothetical protein